MASIIKPGARIVYMKVGTHANEPLDQILDRKLKEIDEAGVAFWGYGGSTCHPVTTVQPFARSYAEEGGKIYLCMHPMVSKHFALTVPAEEFSIDGFEWEPVPKGIKVTGSRYALVIKNLQEEKFNLPLDATRVALGNQMGAPGSKYISGRVDKACLEITDVDPDQDVFEEREEIGLVAEIADPYAVFVRNTTK
jgi:hypothetical protein